MMPVRLSKVEILKFVTGNVKWYVDQFQHVDMKMTADQEDCLCNSLIETLTEIFLGNKTKPDVDNRFDH